MLLNNKTSFCRYILTGKNPQELCEKNAQTAMQANLPAVCLFLIIVRAVRFVSSK